MATKEHSKQWEFLKNKFESDQLAHAYLFSGPARIGKKIFAKEFVKLINCQEVKKPCGACVSCTLIEKESFPDLFVVKSSQSDSSMKNEKDMMEIDVSQMRQANNFLSYTSYYGNYKTVVVEDAERMNPEAQNSFLKTLEEPKGKTVIMLIAKNPDALLPTISSRCQAIKFFPFEKYQQTHQEQKTLQELMSILPAELATKFQYAKKANLDGENFNTILEVLQRYFRNTMLIKMNVMSGTVLPQFANYPMEKLKKIIRLIEDLHKRVATTNASPKLALEILLMEI